MSTLKGTTGQARQWFLSWWANDVFRSRAASHAAVVLLLVAVVVVSTTSLITVPAHPKGTLSLSFLPSEQSAPRTAPSESTQAEELALPAAPVVEEGNILRRMAVPYTIIPERPREEIVTYVVQPGDNILGIAAQFGISGETLMWANGGLEDNPDMLRVGQELTVLPLDGVYHQVGADDTIDAIASTFKSDPAAIVQYPLNNLDADNPQLQVGQWLIVPGGTKPYVPRRVVAYGGPIPEEASKGTGSFGWPAAGDITQGYWDRHRAIDVGTWKGAPILAADSGYVAAAGWDDSGYGRMVIIDHGNGFQTLYAHMEKYYVEVGDSVAKGEQIGEVGSTGNSTGPHLHFEVMKNGVQRNPFGFLP